LRGVYQVNNLAVQSIRELLNSEEKYCISALDNLKNGISGHLKNHLILFKGDSDNEFREASIKQKSARNKFLVNDSHSTEAGNKLINGESCLIKILNISKEVDQMSGLNGLFPLQTIEKSILYCLKSTLPDRKSALTSWKLILSVQKSKLSGKKLTLSRRKSTHSGWKLKLSGKKLTLSDRKLTLLGHKAALMAKKFTLSCQKLTLPVRKPTLPGKNSGSQISESHLNLQERVNGNDYLPCQSIKSWIQVSIKGRIMQDERKKMIINRRNVCSTIT
jgi:hypothetical protein